YVISTQVEINIDEFYWYADAPLEQYPPSETTKESRFIHFMLNERTRELLGELHRWNDLVRTETLHERVSLFHSIAAVNIKPFHKLRPIPQAHLERLYSAGKPLSAAERNEIQNPGY